MITKFKFLLNVMMIALAVGFSSCQGDKGEVGPKGPVGDKGEAGIDGSNGKKGDPGDPNLSFGNIEVTVTGTTPDEEEFSQVLDFKYLLDNMSYSSLNIYDTDTTIHVGRIYKSTFASNGKTQNASYGNSIDLDFTLVDGTPVINNFDFNTYITTDQGYFHVGSSNDSGVEFSDYSYDAATGSLKFKFTFTYVDNADNDVTVSGDADVVVVQKIQN